MKAREKGLRHSRRIVDQVGPELFLEYVGHLESDCRRVAVTREIDQARHEAAVAIPAHEQASLTTLLDVQNSQSSGGELVCVDVEELVAWVGLEQLLEVLVGVTVDAEATVLEHGLGGLAHDRDREHGLDVRRRREQPEESALAHDAPVGVERLDADIVEVGRADHERERGPPAGDEQSLRSADGRSE